MISCPHWKRSSLRSRYFQFLKKSLISSCNSSNIFLDIVSIITYVLKFQNYSILSLSNHHGGRIEVICEVIEPIFNLITMISTLTNYYVLVVLSCCVCDTDIPNFNRVFHKWIVFKLFDTAKLLIFLNTAKYIAIKFLKLINSKICNRRMLSTVRAYWQLFVLI